MFFELGISYGKILDETFYYLQKSRLEKRANET